MVYARVSKTRGCNDLESSSLSSGTMVEGKVEPKQYEFIIREVPGLKTTSREAEKAQKKFEADLQAKYETANKLSQDQEKMKLWQKLERGGQKLEPEHEELLRLAKKILSGGLVFRRNGWVELAEDPEKREQQELGSEAVPQAGNRVVEGVVETIERS